MKKLIALFLIVSSYASAQTDSTLFKRLNLLEQNMSQVAKNLQYSHDRFRSGTGILIAGAAVGGVGAVLINEKTGPYALGAGGLLAVIGLIVQIDSHKFIDDAGRISTTSNGVAINLNR